MPLYTNLPDSVYRTQRGMEGASKSLAGMDKKRYLPGKTIGGALATAGGAGLAGASIGAGMAAAEGASGFAALGAGPIGWGAAGLALAAYYLS